MNPLVANDPIIESVEREREREGLAGVGKKSLVARLCRKLEISSIIVLYTITMELRFVPMEHSCNSTETK